MNNSLIRSEYALTSTDAESKWEAKDQRPTLVWVETWTMYERPKILPTVLWTLAG